MSEYRRFERCVICRSYKNLKQYHGSFEETMLINTLYMAVMFPIELRQSKGTAKAKQIVKYLNSKCAVDLHGNDFTSDDIVRCLRNALAHFNIKVESNNGVVSSVKLWAINRPQKPICKPDSVCGTPKCIPVQYNTNEDSEICSFFFTMPDLREFTYFVMDHALSLLPDSICQNCEHKSVHRN